MFANQFVYDFLCKIQAVYLKVMRNVLHSADFSMRSQNHVFDINLTCY